MKSTQLVIELFFPSDEIGPPPVLEHLPATGKTTALYEMLHLPASL